MMRITVVGFDQLLTATGHGELNPSILTRRTDPPTARSDAELHTSLEPGQLLVGPRTSMAHHRAGTPPGALV